MNILFKYPLWVYLAVFVAIIIAIVIIQMRATEKLQPQDNRLYQVWPECLDKQCEICNKTTDDIPMGFSVGAAGPVMFPHGFSCTVSPPKPEL